MCYLVMCFWHRVSPIWLLHFVRHCVAMRYLHKWHPMHPKYVYLRTINSYIPITSAESAADFSAIAYSAAAEIARLEGVPVGIIDLSVGGSNTESWISRRALEQDNLLASYIHNWRTSDFIQDFCRTRGAKNLELSK